MCRGARVALGRGSVPAAHGSRLLSSLSSLLSPLPLRVTWEGRGVGAVFGAGVVGPVSEAEVQFTRARRTRSRPLRRAVSGRVRGDHPRPKTVPTRGRLPPAPRLLPSPHRPRAPRAQNPLSKPRAPTASPEMSATFSARPDVGGAAVARARSHLDLRQAGVPSRHWAANRGHDSGDTPESGRKASI